jgi:hypothetical protein
LNEPTVKAQTLPEDLKGYWEDGMANKFPMTIEEACAYIRGHYMNSSPYIQDGKICCSITIEKRVAEGEHPGYTPSGGGWIDTGRDYNSYTRKLVAYEYVYIDDFRKNVIDEKMKAAGLSGEH